MEAVDQQELQEQYERYNQFQEQQGARSRDAQHLDLFSAEDFKRSLLAAVVLFLAFFVAWSVPALLKLLFRRVLRAEVVYYGPHGACESAESHARRRRRYARASYWRTLFFQFFYATIGIGLLLAGVVVALWLLHWDFWFLLAGLGIYAAIALFQVGTHLHNIFAFFCLTMDAHAQIRKGDRLRVGGHEGVLVAIGLQRVCLCAHKSEAGGRPPQQATPQPAPQYQHHHHHQNHGAHQPAFFFAGTASPSTVRPPSAATASPWTADEADIYGRHAHPDYNYIFLPTASLLMQSVVRLERPC